jgi:hypothetical protein
MKQDNETLRDVLQAVVLATEPYHQNDISGRPWLSDALAILGAQPVPITQGTLLTDGSVVAVIMSPEDIQTVAESYYGKGLTVDEASECIRRWHGRMTDALLHGWAENLSDIPELEDFIQDKGNMIQVR